ncbi:MAG: hypothetical protein AB1792_10370 [Candidatus Zixiibacteriota bacterium]
MKRIIVATIIVLLAGAVGAAAQSTTSQASSGATSFSGAPRVSDLTGAPKALGFALLDPSRLRMHQSYSLSYFSGGGSSGSLGLYSNMLEYDLFKPLTLRVGLSYAHQPFGASDRSGGSVLGSGQFLPSFGLDYHPSNNFLLSIDYQTIPAVVWPYGGSNIWRANSWWGPFGPRSW